MKDDYFLYFSWLIQICFGLQFIHKKNILHRDLKTQNIFLTSQNLIKIGDFGISKEWIKKNFGTDKFILQTSTKSKIFR